MSGETPALAPVLPKGLQTILEACRVEPKPFKSFYRPYVRELIAAGYLTTKLLPSQRGRYRGLDTLHVTITAAGERAVELMMNEPRTFVLVFTEREVQTVLDALACRSDWGRRNPDKVAPLHQINEMAGKALPFSDPDEIIDLGLRLAQKIEAMRREGKE